MPGIPADRALRLLGEARVAILATVGPTGAPHAVPFVFVLDGRSLYWAVDRKPKRSMRLKRLSNIAANPNVSLVVDHYAEDWNELWWVRATGTARVVDTDDERDGALALLAAKFPQYVAQPPEGPVVAVDLVQIVGWDPRGRPA